jgi:hypothetical protein
MKTRRKKSAKLTELPIPSYSDFLILQGKFGHEFLEFEFRPDGRLRYANNSNYKNDAWELR